MTSTYITKSNLSGENVHKSSGASLVFWLVVVTAVPVAVCSEFGITIDVAIDFLRSSGIPI